jgi:hypothetical protein
MPACSHMGRMCSAPQCPLPSTSGSEVLERPPQQRWECGGRGWHACCMRPSGNTQDPALYVERTTLFLLVMLIVGYEQSLGLDN